ncbi:OpgC domain-containing protein [Falsirhodobacter halotolerans]|uniref:OpgC domain-containing protein n=1 Tax=Falsirhodobacter halotolerans TaxID=1146892 RepID=UPI001FCFFE72|nr:OpgC domain-containing protein [Falsirhodobacter halotolerans]MCJ8139817.1 OpgC domain-containing protein [Falsirhodobacter halotolerans]
MSRIIALDGLRGWLLISMTLSHIVLGRNHWVSEFHFRHFMFVESAQGFIFISGLLFGMIQYRRLQRMGPGPVWISAGRRAAQLWIATVLLTFAFMILRDTLPEGVDTFRYWLAVSSLQENMRMLAVMLLAFQPTFLDILPQYILFLLMAPAVLLLVRRDMWPVAAALTTICWMASQLGLMLPFYNIFNGVFMASDGQGLRFAFDPMGWQLLFMTGVIFGSLMQRGSYSAADFFPKGAGWPVAACLVLLFFAPLRIATAHGWLDGDTISVFVMMEKRADFGPVYVLNFIAACWLMGWLLYRGPNLASPILRRVANGLQRAVHVGPVVVLGQHALLTYVWHVILIYALHYVDRNVVSLTGATGTAVLLLLFGLLFVPATIRQRLGRAGVTAPGASRLARDGRLR